MAKEELKLNLENKGSVFRVVGFLSSVELPEDVVAKFADIVDSEDDPNARDLIVLFQSIGSLLVDVEDELDDLLAELAAVNVDEIEALSIKEYVALIASFFEADFIEQARELWAEFRA